MKRRIGWIAILLSSFIMISLFSGVAYAATGDTIVYRTRTGKKYHTKDCPSLKSSYELTLQEAVNLGLDPCGTCHPPTLDETEDSSFSSPGKPVKGPFSNGAKFDVVISADCKDYNSVGNNWVQEFKINGDVIEPVDVVAFSQNDELEIVTIITEIDKYDDVGTRRTICTVTKKDFSKGFTVKQKVEVTENRGRYAGNTAIWEVVYKFTRSD